MTEIMSLFGTFFFKGKVDVWDNCHRYVPPILDFEQFDWYLWN